METCNIIWFINDTTTEHDFQRDRFIEKGYSFSYLSDRLNNLFGSRLSVTASATVNNTQLRCEAEIGSDYAMSSTAMLLVISGKLILNICLKFIRSISGYTTEPLVIPNPLVVILPTSIILEWSPPYLWTGYRISYYNISTTNTTDGAVTYYVINATFNDPIVTHHISRQDQECTEFIFGISAVSTAGEVLRSYEETGQYQQG